MTKEELLEVFNEVVVAWKPIANKYFPEDVKMDLRPFNDIGEGISFKLTLPHTEQHHYSPSFKLLANVITNHTSDNHFSLRKALLLEVGRQIIYQVGNYEIDEAYDVSFVSQNHYSKRDLGYLHLDEDMILEVAQAMVVGSHFEEFDGSVDRKYGLLSPFTNNQLTLIKAIYRGVSKEFDLTMKNLTLRAFDSVHNNHQYQEATLTFATSKDLHELKVNIFPNQIQKYAQLFAEHGLGEEEAIYFIIRTYLAKEVNKFNPVLVVNESTDENAPMLLPKLKDEKITFANIVEKLPKHFYELVGK